MSTAPDPADAQPLGVPDRLIQAGIEILTSEDHRDLSLRRIAARAGLSHAAPGHYFGGLAGLLAAISAEGFRMFHARLDALDPDDYPLPFQWLVRINAVYLEFAQDHPHLFRLMFDHRHVHNDDMQDAARRTHSVLRQVCLRLTHDPARADDLLMAVWALTHGYAALGMDYNHPNFPTGTVGYERLLRLLVGPAAGPQDGAAGGRPA